MNFDKKIEELYIELQEPVYPKENFSVPAILAGKQLFLTPQYPYSDGRLLYKGRLGVEVSFDQGMTAARFAAIQALSVMRQTLGSLNRVKQILKLRVMIAVGSDFRDHEKVADGTSKVLEDVFGKAARSVRSVTGVSSLPHQACLSVEMVVEIR